MPHIQQLAPHVADLIAAGEVVERPASVVKELMENAIDAGASAITVEIENGGMTYIRVTDNGCGIAMDELGTAFLRHATSKLRTAADLGAIGTLGFRGEALAAISAVSRMDVFTRPKDAQSGAALSLEGGVAGAVREAGCPEGTTMVVRDLFYNTPARLKFMKKDSAEAAAINGVVQHLSLSNPHISFRLIKDGNEVLHTSGDNKLSSAIYAALGREFALGLTEVEGSGENVQVKGFVTRPLCGRGTRGMQVFFVNGRFIKSPLLTAALEEAYKNQIMKGKFPGCVLHITVPADQVDVNVHPAKTVVKFAYERSVFSAVHHVVQDTLDGKKPTPAVPAAPASVPQPKPAAPIVLANTSAVKKTEQPAKPRQDFYQTMDARTFREREEKKSEKSAAAPFVSRIPPVSSELGGHLRVSDVKKPVMTTVVLPEEEPKKTVVSTPVAEETKVAAAPAPEQVPFLSVEKSEPVQLTMEPEQPAPWRFAGEVLHTYIIAEDGENVWLIDKHAAHERINFDRLKAKAEPIVSQQLLSGEAVKLSPEDCAVLLEQLPLLEEFGFEAEDFGGSSIMVRAIPADIDAGQITETLEMLAQRLRTAGTASAADARDAMLHTIACKSAIKGGWISDERELKVLIEKVQSGEVRYCPHGRPVAVKLTKYEIEKMFKRA